MDVDGEIEVYDEEVGEEVGYDIELGAELVE